MRKISKKEIAVCLGGIATTAAGFLARTAENEREVVKFLAPFNDIFSGQQLHQIAHFSREFLPHYGIVPAASLLAEKPITFALNNFLKDKSDPFSKWAMQHPRETSILLMWLLACLYEPIQFIAQYGDAQKGDILGDTVGLIGAIALPRILGLLGDVFNGKKKPAEAEEEMANLGSALSQERLLGEESTGKEHGNERFR